MHLSCLLIPLIKRKNDEKSDKYFVTIKLLRDLTSEKLDLYEFKIALLGNSNPEEFLLFISNFNMTLEESVTLKYDAKIQYLGTLVCGEVLRQFDMLSAEVGIATPEILIRTFFLLMHF